MNSHRTTVYVHPDQVRELEWLADVLLGPPTAEELSGQSQARYHSNSGEVSVFRASVRFYDAYYDGELVATWHLSPSPRTISAKSSIRRVLDELRRDAVLFQLASIT